MKSNILELLLQTKMSFEIDVFLGVIYLQKEF